MVNLVGTNTRRHLYHKRPLTEDVSDHLNGCYKTTHIHGCRSGMETLGAYHLARKSGNFGLKSNGKVIFRKFHSEIVEYLQRYSSFSVRNGTAEISLPFPKLSSFQSLISRQQLRENANGKRHFVWLVCWFWKNSYHYSTLVPIGLFWQMASTPFLSSSFSCSAATLG